MRNLFNFILRNSHWLVAILLIAFSFYLVFAHNSYQRSVYLTSANRVTGWFYTTTNDITSFFLLKKNNADLLERNAELEERFHTLRVFLDSLANTDSVVVEAFAPDSVGIQHFDFIPAGVVNMSFSGVNNFITLDKGATHGIKRDMGVISQQGVVGVVASVSPNFSVVIPIINPKFRLSARLRNSENNGSVSWDGNNIRRAQLQDLPKHEVFHEGDTVLTSFSRIFPKNTIIGFVSDTGKSVDDNFNTFDIQLATDFYTLQDVLVINDRFYDEQQTLEDTLRQ
ncbi:MAG: rod shape-determining protein MreC [Bacteroidetes bacterium GWD2_45_23]|nr:MAG: rod shape-determining protein MreC [Bacteroidetes bacterium GWC2_46_850]OFX67057.1 MAG: rod shape-determining protein MreC [Bacteroidetes bacterium GWC1_47_7]OFX86706.1 MAG: rod shape-determining protein MreC [Bacteroidetes bacterium GWD2_45_23]HAR37340.1 rod shape-determining protein MreC [Porphyromonadaceae bacterium]HBB01979.1 rod shape-determining protein MreC [Porphyromonadaceae bacterium]